MRIRRPTSADLGKLGNVAEAAGLFPCTMMPDMIAPALAGGSDVWLVAEDDGEPQAFSFSRREEMADRVWNVLAIGVHPDRQGAGIGTALLQATEAALPGARMIIIETTQLAEQQPARALYTREGYAQIAHIPDFFAQGEDKIVFVKRLEAAR